MGLLSPVRAGTRAESLSGDGAFLRAMLDVEAALARAQARVGLVPAGAADTITAVCRSDGFDLRKVAVEARGAANPVVVLVRRLSAAVAEVDPAAADHVHRGSTSQDIFDTATMLVASRCRAALTEDLDELAGRLAALAGAHRDTPLPGRTLTQHAVPTTFGLKVAGWLQAVRDARARTAAVALPFSLGGAAGTLAGYVEQVTPESDRAGRVDRLLAAFAAETGLVEPVLPWHTLRTPVLDLAFALAVATGAVGKIAMDVHSMSRTEVGEVAEPAAAGRGVSSAMPQKRNPVLATMIVSAGLQLPPLVGGLTQRMLAEDERPAAGWHAEWQPLRECLRLAGGAVETGVELVRGLRPDPERMRSNLGLTGDLMLSERVAVALVPVLGRAAAKELVATAAARAAASGGTLAAELAAAPQLRDRVTPAALAELLDPAQYLGVAGHLVDRALRDFHTC